MGYNEVLPAVEPTGPVDVNVDETVIPAEEWTSPTLTVPSGEEIPFVSPGTEGVADEVGTWTDVSDVGALPSNEGEEIPTGISTTDVDAAPDNYQGIPGVDEAFTTTYTGVDSAGETFEQPVVVVDSSNTGNLSQPTSVNVGSETPYGHVSGDPSLSSTNQLGQQESVSIPTEYVEQPDGTYAVEVVEPEANNIFGGPGEGLYESITGTEFGDTALGGAIETGVDAVTENVIDPITGAVTNLFTGEEEAPTVEPTTTPEPTVEPWEEAGYSSASAYQNRLEADEWEGHFLGNSIDTRGGYNQAGQWETEYRVGDQIFDNYSDASYAGNLASADPNERTILGDSDGDGIYEYAYGGQIYDNFSDAYDAEQAANPTSPEEEQSITDEIFSGLDGYVQQPDGTYEFQPTEATDSGVNPEDPYGTGLTSSDNLSSVAGNFHGCLLYTSPSPRDS